MKSIPTKRKFVCNTIVSYLLLFFSLFIVFESQAQVNYSVASFTGTYTTLSGANITTINSSAGLTATTGMPTPSQDDGMAIVNLPFAFNYVGNNFTQVGFCTNGWIGLGNQTAITASQSRTGGNLFTTAVPNNTMGAWFKDMGANFPATQPGTGPGTMRHGLTGTDIYTFQWDQAVGSSFSITTTTLISFQITLYGPSSGNNGRIEFLYGPTSGTIAATGANIGIENSVGGSGNFLNALNGSTTTSSTSTGWPGNGNGYRFTPFPACVAPVAQPTALTLTPVSTSQINGSFTAAAGSPSGYLVVRYPAGATPLNPSDGVNYTVGQSLGTGTVVSVGASTTFSNTFLSASSTYDYYVYAYNNTTCSFGPAYNTTVTAGDNFNTASTPGCGSIPSPLTVGPTGTYPTLTSAIAAVAATGISAPLVIEMQSTYTGAGETYPITWSFNGCITAAQPITIQPEASATSPILITSNNATATIDLNGAAYVTFDGRPGGLGADKFLVIENTGTTGQAVLLRNDASNNTLTYLDVRAANGNAANNTTTAVAGSTIPGAIAIGTTTGLNGNDNNTISFCDVHSLASGGNLGVGIYAYNSTTAGAASNNDNNTISGNNIYDFFLGTTASAAINITAGNNAFTITNNRIYQTAPRTYTSTQVVRAFWITPNTGSLTSASGYVISGNTIGFASAAGTGVTTMSGTTTWSFNGMDLSLGLGTASSVQNNTITSINMTSGNTGSTAFVGINIANGNVDIGTVAGNLIGSTTTNGSIAFTATANTGGVLGIRTGGGNVLNIANNQISGIDLFSSVLTVTPVFNGIAASGGTTINITNNTVGSLTLANSINLVSASTSTSIQSVRGITANSGTTVRVISGNTIANMNTNVVATGTQTSSVQGIQATAGACTISNNLIRNLTSSSQSTSGGANPSVIGISFTSTTAPAVISNNTIHTLKNTNTATVSGPVVTGIYYGGASGTANVIEKNNIHSLVLSSPTVSTAAAITGMDIATGQCTIRNNMIRLGYDENGNSITVPTLMRGISKNSNIASIYFNSVFIGGTDVLGTVSANTFAFTRTAAANTDDIRNNIFVNNRSNATTGGKHYQINLTSTATLTLNYNNYFGNGTGSVFGLNGTTDVATYSAGWVTGDINSQPGDPKFINPTGSAATGDLHIDPALQTVIEQNGINISSVTDDFDGQIRTSFTPDDIGADAGDFIGFFCSGGPASATAVKSDTIPVCGSGVKTLVLTGFTPEPGYTYQWQESSTGLPGTFVNVTTGTGGNQASYTTPVLTSTTYYQCIIACNFGGSPITSSVVTVTVNPIPVISVTPATGTNVCSGANVDLTASGANTYTWAVNPGVAGYPVVSLLTTRNNLAKVTSRPTSTLASSTANPPATVATPTWTYTVTGTALSGCTAQASVVLNVVTTPVVPVQLTYTYLPDPVCAPGTPVTFTVNNPGSVGTGSWIYNWYDQTGATLLQSTTSTSSSDDFTPPAPSSNGNYIYQVRTSNTDCPASYAVASPSYFVGYTSLNVVSNANCGDNGIVTVYPEGQNSFTTWYSNNFNSGLLGPAFDASFGNTNFTGGRANITPQTNSQTGALIIRNSAFINSNNLQVDFKMSTGPRGFAFNILGADGMCWSYGGDVTVGTVTTGGQGEGGSGTGLKLAFDATANGPNNLPGAYLMYNCTVVGQGPGDPGVLAYKLGSWWQGLVDAPVSIVISQNGFVTVTVNNEVIFDHVALPAAYLTTNKSNWIHAFTARTGGSNQLHAIDDLNIRYNSYEYSNNSTTGLDGTWQSTNTFSGLAAGTYPLWVRNPTNPSCVSNVGNAVVGISPSPSSALTVASPGFNTTICAGSSTDLTTDVSIPGAVFLWESSTAVGGPYTPAPGVNNAAVYSTGTLLSSAYYRVTFTCPGSSPITSTPVLVTVNSGSIASTNSPVLVNCLNTTATVTANPGPNTTIVWYANQTGGSPLSFGNSYSFTATSLPVTFYAEPVTTIFTNHYDFGGEKSVGGNLNGGSIGGTNISSRFTTTASIRIDSIKVLPNAAGTLTVALQNAGSSTNISTFNLTITSTQVGTFVNVPVNFVVTGSGNYQLTTSGVSCSYNNSYPPANYGLSYMNLGGVFSIVGGSTTPTGANSTSVYGTAFNWSITTSCPTGGARVPVVVQPNPAYAVSVSPASTTYCAGNKQMLIASSTNPYSYYEWSPVTNLFADSAATIPYVAGSNEDTVYAVFAAGGSVNYTVSTAQSGCLNTGTATVTALVTPNMPVITQNPLIACGNNPITLTASVSQPGVALIGSASSTNATTGQSPFSNFYEGSRIQYLITAGELIAAGVSPGPINSIAWNVTTANTTLALSQYSIKMGSTPATTLSAFQTGLTTVYSAASYTPSAGLNTFTFGTTFVWDGTSNVIVEVCHNNDPTGICLSCYSGTSTVQSSTTAFTSVYGQYSDNTVPANPWDLCSGISSGTVSSGTNRPDVRLGYSSATNLVWSTGDTTQSITFVPGLGSTTYTATATNAGGCSASSSITVTAAASPQPVITTPDTNLCNPGQIYVRVGDQGSYSSGYPAGTTFTWKDATGATYFSAADVDSISSTSGSSFYVEVILPNGCFGISDTSFVVTKAVAVLSNTLGTSCSNNDGSIVVDVVANAFNGVIPPYNFIWSTDLAQTNIIKNVTKQNTQDTLVGLAPGTYYLQVYDAAGTGASCNSGVIPFTISSPPPIDLTVSGTDLLCNGSSDGGVTANWTGGTAPFQIVWSNGGTVASLSGLSGGTYSVTVTDAAGCIASGSTTISEPAALQLSFSSAPASSATSSDGSATVSVVGGTAPYTFEWYDELQAPLLGQTAAVLDSVLPGLYYCFVVDVNNCFTAEPQADSVRIGFLNEVDLQVRILIGGFYVGQGQMTPVLQNSLVGSDPLVVDTVRIELRHPVNYNTLYGTNTVLDLSGEATISIPGSFVGSSAYIAVLHRNAVQTWSALPVSIGSSTAYDFTTSASQAFGSNQGSLGGGLYGLYSGDVNQDNFVDLLDQIDVDNDVANFAGGYLFTDLTGNGEVDILDQIILDNNASNFVEAIIPQ